MIRNGHSVMLLAIVAAVVVEGPAAMRRHGPGTRGDSERSGALNERCVS